MPIQPRTISDVLKELRSRPQLLIEQWNWKSALFSSALRAIIFLFTNLSAGWHAAAGAMSAEFVFRAVTSGFYGSLSQAFRTVEPPWTAYLTLLIFLPISSHSLEILLHLARGTPRLMRSVIASVIFTEIAVLFNLAAMRRGMFMVGSESASLASDLKKFPALLADFVLPGRRSLPKTNKT